MPERAHVTSVEALDAFRTNLILYVSKARPALEDVSAGVLRTRLWLQNEQRLHLENEVRRRGRELEQAQQALARVRLSNLNQSSVVEQKAVQKAKSRLEEGESKLKKLKQWNREFDSRVGPLVKQLETLHTMLANDMLKATAFLAQAIKTLDAYSHEPLSSTSHEPSAPPAEAPPESPLAGPSGETPERIDAREAREERRP